MKNLKRYSLMLAKPHIVFYTMIWLMIILIVGTVAQKYIGLYRAQNLFFFSWVIWMGGFIPLPGGLMTLGFLTTSMLAKLFLASKWALHNAGTIVTHIGVLLLLLGGLVTYAMSQEGSMLIYEGETSHYFTDYHERELVVEEKDTGAPIAAFPWKNLRQGVVFTIPNTPIKIEIVKLCRNCAIFPRQTPENDSIFKELRGRAVDFDIAPIPSEKEDEANQSAVQFRISGASDDKNGIHFSTDFIDISPWVEFNGKTYNIALRKKRTMLPFSIQLIDFEKTYHPGTDMAKSYQSEVILRENGTEWRSLIQMNEPLRYRGYTFYQSSFIEDNGKEATILAVVKNAGRLFPYISSIVMCIGLLIHLAMQLPKLITRTTIARAGKAILVLGLLMGFTPSVHAETSHFNNTDFSKIPVLDEGRVKPLDTFARSYLEVLSGKDTIGDMQAIDWLSEVLFDPDRAYGREIFNVASPSVRDALELPQRPKHRYSYREISAAFFTHTKAWQSLFQTPENQMTMPQKQLLELFNKITLYAQLSRSFSLLFPDFTVSAQSKTYVDLQSQISELEAAAKTDSGAKTLLDQLREREKDSNSNLLRIIPPQWSGHGSVWFAPWEIGNVGAGSPDTVKFLKLWGGMINAYRTGNTAEWATTATEIRAFSENMAGKLAPPTLTIESFFNVFKPFTMSFYFYLAAFAAILASFLGYQKQLWLAAFGLLVVALGFNAAGLGIRMLIMHRPPVTNLYGSIVFVSFIIAAGGALLEGRLRNSLGIIIAAAAGAFLQLVGIKFDSEGDTMGQIVAVLDTNFWLGTHVVMMTTGYGCSLIGGLLGHVYLVRRLLDPNNRHAASDIFRNMRGVILVAIFFTSLGTILGGIWADQSWGRFWGWDPKENGALLIVLWLVWMVHGRLSGKLGELGFSTAMALTLIVVGMAWFGVNMLGVGLHSYGFTQSATVSFVVFCGVESIFILGSFALIKRREMMGG